MYYFKHENDSIEKYAVIFEKEKIERLKRIIINNFSKIVHREIDSTIEPNTFDYLKIRNLNKKIIGIKKYDDGPDEVLYHFSYDEYIYPYLVTLINRLLKEDADAIDEIFLIDSYDEKNPISEYYLQIQKLLSFQLLDIIRIEKDKKRYKTKKKRR